MCQFLKMDRNRGGSKCLLCLVQKYWFTDFQVRLKKTSNFKVRNRRVTSKLVPGTTSTYEIWLTKSLMFTPNYIMIKLLND